MDRMKKARSKDRKERKEWRVWQSESGWAAESGEGEPLEAGSLPEIVAVIPAGQPYDLCLPQSFALFSSAEFPKVEREELDSMVGLQAERLFCLSEAECSLAIGRIEERDDDLWVTVWGVSHEQVKGLLGEIRRLPRALVLQADLLASRVGGARLLMFCEGDEVVIALLIQGEVAWTANLPALAEESEREAEVRRVAMSMSLEMPNAAPKEILFTQPAEGWAVAWAALTGLPFDKMPVLKGHAEPRIVWTPNPWRDTARKVERRQWVLRAGLALAALYLLFVGWEIFGVLRVKSEADQLVAREAELRPVVEQVAEAKSMWERVAIVTERRRSPLEILDLMRKLVPSQGLLLTRLEVTPDGFDLQAEADEASLAFAFTEAVKNHDVWRFEQMEVTDPRMVQGKQKWRVQIRANGWEQ